MPKIFNVDFNNVSKVSSISGSSINNIDNISFNNSNKSLVLGGWFKACEIVSNGLIRVFPDGTQDTTLNIGTGFKNSQSTTNVNCMEFLDNDSMFIGGNFNTYNGVTSKAIIKLTSGGTIEQSFSLLTDGTPEVFSMKKQSDNKIIIGGNFINTPSGTKNRILRINTDGSIDNTFNIGTGFNNAVKTINIDSLGSIYVGGDFTTYSGITANRLIKLNTDGTIDYSFNCFSGFNGTVETIQIDSLGGIYVGGNFTTYRGVANNRIIKLNSDGTKDVTFDNTTGFNAYVRNIKIDSSNRLYVCGEFTTYKGAANARLLKLNTDGTKDTSFDNSTPVAAFNANNAINMRAIEITGSSLFIGGTFSQYKATFESSIIKLDTSGNKDSSFNNSGGITGNENIVNGIKINSSGNLIIFGNFNGYKQPYGLTSVKSYDGTVSKAFNPNYGFNVSASLNQLSVWSLLKSSSNNIYVGGYFENYMLSGSPYNYRNVGLSGLDISGTPNPSISVNTGANLYISLMKEDSLGGIYLLGQFTAYKGVSVPRFVKINPDASIDNSFIRTGLPSSGILNMEIDTSNNLYLVGQFTSFSSQTNNRIVKVLPTGYKDETFNTGTGFGSNTNTICLDNLNRVYVGGSFTSYNGVTSNYIVRLNTDGSLDNTFNIGTGFNNYVSFLKVFNNKLYVVGGFTSYNGISCINIARLNLDGTLDNTYNTKRGVVSSIIFNGYFLDSIGNLYILGLDINYQGYGNKNIVKIKPNGSYDVLFKLPNNFFQQGNYINFYTSNVYSMVEI